MSPTGTESRAIDPSRRTPLSLLSLTVIDEKGHCFSAVQNDATGTIASRRGDAAIWRCWGEADVAACSGPNGLADATAARGLLAAVNRAAVASLLVTFFLTNLLFSGTKIHPAHRFIGALLETIPEAEQVRCPRAGLVIPHSGGSGNPPGWHYDRPARSSLPGKPTVTRRASMKRGPGAEPRVQSLGERRGGAPKGERSREGSRPLPA
jgi:hypothetical protein